MRCPLFALLSLSAVTSSPVAIGQVADADALANLARAAASENRHEIAIEQFRAAIANAPDRREEWLVELADQLTWFERINDAVTLYREAAQSRDGKRAYWARVGLARALARRGDHDESLAVYADLLAAHPDDREVGLARAEVLSWAGRQQAASAAYRAILDNHPDDPAARRGLARTLSWDGRHREALHALAPLLQEPTADREAVLVSSEALLWMGRPDRAAEVLRLQLAADPGDARSRALLGKVEESNRPVARADVRQFNQSDELEISEVQIEGRLPLNDGQGFVGARYVGARYRPPAGAVDEIAVDRIGVIGGYRIDDAFNVNASLYNDAIDTGAAGVDRNVVTYEAYLTYTPTDLLRFDAGASRRTFDSEATLLGGLVADAVTASMDIVPDAVTRYSARARTVNYSDGNDESWWQLEAGHRFLKEPFVSASLRVTGFEFSRPGQPGYYNPDSYVSVELPVRIGWNVSEDLHWDLGLAIGHEWEGSATSRAVGSGNLSLSWSVHDQTELQLGYEYSTSSAFSTGGFDRGILRATIVRRF